MKLSTPTGDSSLSVALTALSDDVVVCQAVEYFGEWSLCPDNLVYQRVQTAVYDPSLIGDKPKWYAQHLQPVEFHVYDNASSLAAAVTSVSEALSDEIPTGGRRWG